RCRDFHYRSNAHCDRAPCRQGRPLIVQHVQSSTIFHSMSPTDVADWEKHRSGVDCQVCLSKKNASVQLEASWVLIGPDDPVRGYACLVFGRHAIELHELTEAEGTALMRDIRKLSAAVARAA